MVGVQKEDTSDVAMGVDGRSVELYTTLASRVLYCTDGRVWSPCARHVGTDRCRFDLGSVKTASLGPSRFILVDRLSAEWTRDFNDAGERRTRLGDPCYSSIDSAVPRTTRAPTTPKSTPEVALQNWSIASVLGHVHFVQH